MRPSYDAEHPHSTTPIYDELYSEYRRLFRALPGDRSGEEDLLFTGFAIRDGYPLLGEQRQYPPQQQVFHTYAGQPSGLPQFMPTQSQHSPPTGHTEHSPANAAQHAGHLTGHQYGGHQHNGHLTDGRPGRHGGHNGHSGHHGSQPEAAPGNDGHGQAAAPSPQFTNGQGWVAAGYLGAVPHPAPAPPPPPAPSPVLGTVTGLAAAPPPSGGRHRQMLSLPPGRTGGH
ncbi:hypothetical protein AB0O91_31115 [Kitasatospora sp. NPDC089797]|uniref:hypothetical protein n=1 Tax=Kitasatospora sp. NPDC089797 TaxID=3155298 RepID=UPI00342DB3FF